MFTSIKVVGTVFVAISLSLSLADERKSSKNRSVKITLYLLFDSWLLVPVFPFRLRGVARIYRVYRLLTCVFINGGSSLLKNGNWAFSNFLPDIRRVCVHRLPYIYIILRTDNFQPPICSDCLVIIENENFSLC